MAALLAVSISLLDIVISFGGEDFNPAALSAIDWFGLFQESRLSGLRALVFLNIISLTVSVSLYYALFTAHRQGHQALVGAGESILARGADFTPGSFIGFFFTEMAGWTFSLLVLLSGMFSRATEVAGIVGFGFLAMFTIWVTFMPTFFDLAMLVAMVGGLSSVGWYILVARRLFQMA